ncbi:iron uptake porin [Lyngbya confervoides]|uniref:Iron uptake porin n=1 Tax=Lyngbya confervoides BDU141951 TaxID=1574623 RepID=A0ABD4TA48_9CYAN|nr:iron uptake porin [Lyngbya confervoides]MCM1985372.1 iron uptake porin [Lyngbya confervoides BDU141951]
MKKTFLLAGSLSLLGLASTLSPASAEQVTSVNELMSNAQDESLGQVTSVSQLSDVQPTDWAFQAVQSLVERYGCVAGYPDGTFRGNRAATRYEMAALVNACLDNISDQFATKEDLEALRALQEEFAAELATLRGRVDGLEARTATLEAQQFSTTTKLQGEAVIAGQYGDFLDSDLDFRDVNSPGSVLIRQRAAQLSDGNLANGEITGRIPPNNAAGVAQILGITPAAAAALLNPANNTKEGQDARNILGVLNGINPAPGAGALANFDPNAVPGALGAVFPFPAEARPSVLSRVRLSFNTSFSGSDLLQTQLEVGSNGRDYLTEGLGFSNSSTFPLLLGQGDAPTGLADLGALDYSGVPNTVVLRRLAYSFKPFNDDLTLTFGSRLFPSDFVDFNSYANNSAQDFGSGFFINNPLIIQNAVDFPGGAGAAFDWNPNGGPFSLRATYVAANPTNAVAGNCDNNFNFAFGGASCKGGFIGDANQATAELEYADTFGSSDQNSFAIRAQYTRASTYNVHSNVVGANAELTLGKFGVFGRFGYSIDPKRDVANLATADPFDELGKVDLLPAGIADNNILTWMAGVGVNDLIVPGSLLAVAAGQPQVFTGVANFLPYESQWNFEGFYRIPINDNISLTPSVMVILNPYNIDTSALLGPGVDSTVIQGALRATFSF